MTGYALNDIKNLETKPAEPWWYVVILRPLVLRLVYLFANYTKLTPNQITIISFIIGLASAFYFLHGTWICLVIGAFLFEICYIFDCVDGRIARLKGLKSGFGMYLDSMLDQTRLFFVVLCLVYGQYLSTKDVSYFLFGIVFIFLYLIQSLSWYELSAINEKFHKETFMTHGDTHEHENVFSYQNINKDNTSKAIQNKFPFIWKTKTYFDSKRISIIPTFVEADTLAFFIFPILMQIKLGLLLGAVILAGNMFIQASYFFLINYGRVS